VANKDIRVIYIIGPISGRPNANLEAFQAARAKVRKMVGEYELIVIPHELFTPKELHLKCPALCWCRAMCACLPVARSARMIYALHDWRESPGARVEIRERRADAIVMEEAL
jgi:hypothetical protein